MEEYTVDKITNGDGVKPRLLLHVCCAPCASGVLDALTEKFDVTLFFYNPNVMPENEFNLRLNAVKALIMHYNSVKLIVPERDEKVFTTAVKGLETCREGGLRCELCFKIRLEKTAEYLAGNINRFDYFATTLTVSPHKNAAAINGIGQVAAAENNVKYLSSDFKKKDGFLKSVQKSKELNLYRQSYCGCKFD